ncbi:hypothetical protein H5410_061096 [Solanum commersonii]|uniref:At2g35280-like TPR domain-containing protein n=1 Tax=Solanum commersonii TaxID=4109 RepID=A0A9J5W728_SOLCO|nr:hypothetical protein H5410_061096 [Solanum commersonii]
MTKRMKNYKFTNYIESLPRCLLINIIERIASGSFKDLMNFLNEVGNKPSVYQKVTLVDFSNFRWSVNRRLVVQKSISFLDICRASGNLEALYRKGFAYFNNNDSNAVEMINQADGGHIGTSYVLAIISIFKGC